MTKEDQIKVVKLVLRANGVAFISRTPIYSFQVARFQDEVAKEIVEHLNREDRP